MGGRTKKKPPEEVPPGIGEEPGELSPIQALLEQWGDRLDPLTVALVNRLGPFLDNLIQVERDRAAADWHKAAVIKEKAEEFRRGRVATERRAAAVEQLLARLGEHDQAIDQLMVLMREMLNRVPVSAAITELSEEVRFDFIRTSGLIRLVLHFMSVIMQYVLEQDDDEGKRNLAEKINEAVIVNEKIDGLRRELLTLTGSENKLREQVALYGSERMAPVALQNELEGINSRIGEIEHELAECENRLQEIGGMN